MKKAMSGNNYRRVKNLQHQGLGEQAKIISLRNPKTRVKYNELLQRKQQIIDASKKLEQRPLLVKEKKQLLELNRKVLERVETEREKVAVSSLLHNHEQILEFGYRRKGSFELPFMSEIIKRGPNFEAGLGGIYGEAMNSILKRHKKFKTGELEFILKTVNKSLIEVSKHLELLQGFNNKVDVGLYDATIRQLFKLYAENVFTAPKLVEAMKEMTTELKKTLSQPYPVGNPTGILMHFARKYKAKYPNL